MKHSIKAWAVVNKNFEEQVEDYPRLFSGELFFTPFQARDHIKKMYPKYCKGCGRAEKKKEIHLKVLPISISLSH